MMSPCKQVLQNIDVSFKICLYSSLIYSKFNAQFKRYWIEIIDCSVYYYIFNYLLPYNLSNTGI